MILIVNYDRKMVNKPDFLQHFYLLAHTFPNTEAAESFVNGSPVQFAFDTLAFIDLLAVPQQKNVPQGFGINWNEVCKHYEEV